MLGVGLGAVLAALQGAPCTKLWFGLLLAAQCATGGYCSTAVLAVVSESWIPDSSPFIVFGVGLGAVLAALQGAPCTMVVVDFARGVITEL